MASIISVSVWFLAEKPGIFRGNLEILDVDALICQCGNFGGCLWQIIPFVIVHEKSYDYFC